MAVYIPSHPPPSSFQMVSLDDGYGALYVGEFSTGLVLCTLLHGVTLSQAWHFYSNQSQVFKDPLGLKALVAGVVALDFIHQVCTTHWLYMTLVTNFGVTEKLAFLPPSYLGMAIPTGFVTFLVQNFYVWRIWKLSNKNWLVPGFIACSHDSLQLTDSMSLVARNPDSSTFTGTMTTIVIGVNGMGASIDVVIAIAMLLLLYVRRTRIIRTNRMLRQIAIYSVTTGATTSLCAILVFVSALTLPGNWVLTFYLMLTRMYSNSLLATLNVRDSIRSVAGTSGIIGDSGIVPANPTTPATVTVGSSYHLNDLKRAASSEHQVEGISIKVDRRTEVGEF
ncbi:hypothetical protein PM082_017856 [Marasmius tenuissimus]|nr:hypothetical protein PM082_017856 [Marasmius tenuissimus]